MVGCSEWGALWTLCEHLSSVFNHQTDVRRDVTAAKCAVYKPCPLVIQLRAFPRASLNTTVIQWHKNKLTGWIISALQHALTRLSYCRSSANSPVTGRLVPLWHLKQKKLLLVSALWWSFYWHHLSWTLTRICWKTKNDTNNISGSQSWAHLFLQKQVKNSKFHVFVFFNCLKQLGTVVFSKHYWNWSIC